MIVILVFINIAMVYHQYQNHKYIIVIHVLNKDKLKLNRSHGVRYVKRDLFQ
jgi:hypothetical protein